MDIKFLVKLTSKAWSLTILALLHQGVPGRIAPLLAAAGANRTALSQSLDHLVALGLLERNPGHGHPLRPEFRLTPLGQRWSQLADGVLKAAPTADHAALLRRAWTVPVLTVASRPLFFSEIKRDLPMVTDRALSQSLHLLQDHDWMERWVNIKLHPPRPYYRTRNGGAVVGGLMAAV